MASEDRFAFEWNIHQEIRPLYEIQFKGWTHPLKRKDFKNKTILDAGCGNGRNSWWPLKYGAKKVIAFDHHEQTVSVVKKNLRDYKNAKVVFASIYDIPFKNKFDIAFSIGVIHHLISPRLAVEQLVRATKPGGTVLIWVYGHEGNELYVVLINFLRLATSRLSLKLVYIIALVPAGMVFLATRLLSFQHPYLKQIKHFDFAHTHSIVFDQLLPAIAHYYKRDEALELCRAAGVSKPKAYRVNNNSWTIIGRKTSAKRAK